MNQTANSQTPTFKKIAVAVAFSPRVEAILAESKRLQAIFKASMYFIHVGKKSIHLEEQLKHLVHRFELDAPGNQIIWEEGEPVDVILTACENLQVDLLVAGALEKESLVKYFMGSVARRLCRKAKCSVLMLREPDLHTKPVRHIVVEGSDHPKTASTIETAVYVARNCGADTISIIQEEDVSKMALIRSNEMSGSESDVRKEQMLKDEDDKLKNILDCTDCGNVTVNIERLEGKPGFEISRYARQYHADLLMLNSPDTKLGFIDRVFPHDIEFTLADLPCDVMIVHSERSA